MKRPRVIEVGAPARAPAPPAPAVEVREGQIVELDRSHLASGKALPKGSQKFAAKVTHVEVLLDHPGFLLVTAFSTKQNCTVMFGVPPKGVVWVGPRVRVIR